MKKRITTLTFALFCFSVFGQGVSHMEIWGLKYTKNDFIENYKKQAGDDLNYVYCCAAKLNDMGYKHALSIVYEPKKDKNGTINWDLTERLIVIRQIDENAYTQKALDKEWLKKLENVAKNYGNTYSATSTIKPNDITMILNGSLLPENHELRQKCNSIILSNDLSAHWFTAEEIEIVSLMASFPDPVTCYAAIKIIRNNLYSKSIQDQLFKHGAKTLIEFLSSELQTYRVDAMDFLREIIPENQCSNYTDWIKLINSKTKKGV